MAKKRIATKKPAVKKSAKAIKRSTKAVKKSVGKKITKSSADQLVKKDWYQFYVLAEHWHSDLKFYEDELRFLHSLLDKYFIWLTQDKNIETTRMYIGKLVDLTKRRQAIERETTQHMAHLTELFENPFPHNAQDYVEEHGVIESSMANFSKDFRGLKKEIFTLAEKFLESEKIKHLLPAGNN